MEDVFLCYFLKFSESPYIKKKENNCIISYKKICTSQYIQKVLQKKKLKSFAWFLQYTEYHQGGFFF